jgi:hypothetical protein
VIFALNFRGPRTIAVYRIGENPDLGLPAVVATLSRNAGWIGRSVPTSWGKAVPLRRSYTNAWKQLLQGAANMSDRSEAELSEAIQLCARQCVGQPESAACVRQFCADLMHSGNWSKSDADAVEEAALRVIEHLRDVLT